MTDRDGKLFMRWFNFFTVSAVSAASLSVAASHESAQNAWEPSATRPDVQYTINLPRSPEFLTTAIELDDRLNAQALISAGVWRNCNVPTLDEGDLCDFFQLAVRFGRLTIAKMLFDSGVFDVNFKGYTAIHIAAAHGNKELAEYVLSMGFDAHIRTIDTGLETEDWNGAVNDACIHMVMDAEYTESTVINVARLMEIENEDIEEELRQFGMDTDGNLNRA